MLGFVSLAQYLPDSRRQWMLGTLSFEERSSGEMEKCIAKWVDPMRRCLVFPAQERGRGFYVLRDGSYE